MYVHDTHFNVFIYDIIFDVRLRFYDSHYILLGFFVWVSVTMMKVLLRCVFWGSRQKVS